MHISASTIINHQAPSSSSPSPISIIIISSSSTIIINQHHHRRPPPTRTCAGAPRALGPHSGSVAGGRNASAAGGAVPPPPPPPPPPPSAPPRRQMRRQTRLPARWHTCTRRHAAGSVHPVISAGRARKRQEVSSGYCCALMKVAARLKHAFPAQTAAYPAVKRTICWVSQAHGSEEGRGRVGGGQQRWRQQQQQQQQRSRLHVRGDPPPVARVQLQRLQKLAVLAIRPRLAHRGGSGRSGSGLGIAADLGLCATRAVDAPSSRGRINELLRPQATLLRAQRDKAAPACLCKAAVRQPCCTAAAVCGAQQALGLLPVDSAQSFERPAGGGWRAGALLRGRREAACCWTPDLTPDSFLCKGSAIKQC
jgi:hypothetical protein